MSTSTTTFTKVIDGKVRTRDAHTPAEAVKLRFDGWTEQKATKATASPSEATTATKSTSK